MIDSNVATQMRDAFDEIEEAYEFMLAYAAQGRKTEAASGSKGPSQIRHFLQRFRDAAGRLADLVEKHANKGAGAGFAERWLADIGAARSVIKLLLEQPSITSEMVDNTNGLIVLRSLLTGIFFADQVMLPKR